MKNEIRFIDLFAGIGGIRKGFELACAEAGYETKCVFTSEIKPYAINVLNQNHPQETVNGDITKVDEKDMPDFEFLLAGFPCQAFSAAGKRLGFLDTRGTLFFDVERILKEKKPFGFVLENVEGLVNHDKENPKDKIGRTLTTILQHLDDLGYHVTWRVLNAKDFEVPQDRKRIYIVGTKKEKPSLDNFVIKQKKLGDVLETGLPVSNSRFTELLLSHYTVEELYGKSIKDKRGGDNNIHSWDIEYKGPISPRQIELLNKMLKERRKKKWAEISDIKRIAIMRNHSACHLLQAALRKVLGTHVEQAGSYVDEHRVRFDFSHYEALTAEQLAAVETLVNANILVDNEIKTVETDIETARSMGAMALYVCDESVVNFQPMNVNFGLIPALGYRVKGKRNKNAELSKRALELMDGLNKE